MRRYGLVGGGVAVSGGGLPVTSPVISLCLIVVSQDVSPQLLLQHHPCLPAAMTVIV